MRIKFRTSRPMQTPRDISYTGNPTGGTTAYPAVLPAAHEATENSDNIFYRTIRTVMKKQLICLLASAGLLAAGCSTENAPETTGYGTLSGEPVRTFFLTFSAQDAPARGLCADRPCCTAARRGNTPRKKKPPCNRREVGDKGLWPSGYSGGLVYPLEIFD